MAGLHTLDLTGLKLLYLHRHDLTGLDPDVLRSVVLPKDWLVAFEADTFADFPLVTGASLAQQGYDSDSASGCAYQDGTYLSDTVFCATDVPFMATCAGATAQTRCPNGGRRPVSRVCGPDGQWGEIDQGTCPSTIENLGRCAVGFDAALRVDNGPSRTRVVVFFGRKR